MHAESLGHWWQRRLEVDHDAPGERQLDRSRQAQDGVGLTLPELWAIPSLGEARFLPILVGNAPYEAFRQGEPVGLRADRLDGDSGMEVEEGFNAMRAGAGDGIQQHEVPMTKLKLPPVDRLSHQAAVALVLPHNPQCPIGSDVHRRHLRVGPAGNAKLLPYLALLRTINAHRVMGRGGTDIGAHDLILIRIDPSITDDTLRGQ